jgi:beta-N-acetylhexosaminidase
MSSHPLYPRLDPNPGNLATFSRRIIYDCLREELGFKGIISSDDLEMGAIKEIVPIDVAAVKTVAAGHDLVLSCHDLNAQRLVFNGLLEAYKNRFLPLNELEESVDRIEKLKAKRVKRFEGNVGPHPDGSALAKKVAQEGLQIIQDREKIIPLVPSLRNNVAVIFPQLSSFASKIMVEKVLEDEKMFLHKILGPTKGTHVAEVYKIDVDDRDIENAKELAARSSVTIFFCFDAHLHPKQKDLLLALQLASRKLIVVLMRDPYDKEFLRPQDACLTAFGWRACQSEAVLEKIFQDA